MALFLLSSRSDVYTASSILKADWKLGLVVVTSGGTTLLMAIEQSPKFDSQNLWVGQGQFRY